MNENKKERFKRVASKRMQNTLKEMTRLSNCSNTNSYEYDDKDVQKMMRTLNEKIQELRVAFRKGVKSDNEFKF